MADSYSSGRSRSGSGGRGSRSRSGNSGSKSGSKTGESGSDSPVSPSSNKSASSEASPASPASAGDMENNGMKTKSLGEIVVEDFDKDVSSSRSSSVHITRTNDLLVKDGPFQVSDVHIEVLQQRKEAEISAKNPPPQLEDVQVEAADRNAIAQRMRHNFRRIKEEGYGNTCFKVVEIPLNFLRDYTCPIGDYEAWNRTRAAVVPVFIVLGFLYLNGNLQPTEDGQSYWS